MSDDLSKYENYRGTKPPEIEQVKYRMSLQAKDLQASGKNRSAAEVKRSIARICDVQGKTTDAASLRDGARRLDEKGDTSR